MKKRTLFGVGLVILLHHLTTLRPRITRNLQYKSVWLPGQK